MRRRHLPLLAAFLFLAAPGGVRADPIYDYAYSGTFSSDQGLAMMFFYISQASNVQIYSLSYTGGQFVKNDNSMTPLAGANVAGDGFVPALSVFDLTMVPDSISVTLPQLLAAVKAGDGFFQGASNGGGGPYGSPTEEASLSLDLKDTNAGWYAVVITEYDNTANGDLNQGFAEQGFAEQGGNFTAGYCGDQGPFCDNGVLKDGHWGVGILNVDSSLVSPEPASLLLTFGAILMIGTWRLCRKLRTPVAVADRVPVSRAG